MKPRLTISNAEFSTNHVAALALAATADHDFSQRRPMTLPRDANT
jgi:hypothetical protein